MNDDRARLALKACYEEATKSPDPSTQIGAAIAFESFGIVIPSTLTHNAPVSGWTMKEEDWERPRKYCLMAHAERRALALAAKLGVPTEGKALIATWAACTDCAIQIVESGIAVLVRHVADTGAATNGWEDSVKIGDEIMRAGGVELMNILGPIPGAPKVRRSELLIDPSEGL